MNPLIRTGIDIARPDTPKKVGANGCSLVLRVGRRSLYDARCRPRPFCQRGSLPVISAIPQEEVTTRILRHLKLAPSPSPRIFSGNMV
jgi:hypothetical protein